MKLQLFSDIHVEFSPNSTFQIPTSDADLILLAGDIGEGLAGVTWAAEQSQRVGKPVIVDCHPKLTQGFHPILTRVMGVEYN